MGANYNNLFDSSNSFRQNTPPRSTPLFNNTSGPVQPQGPGALDSVMKILNSPAGAAGISAAGAGIAAYGANKSATAAREQNAQQFNADMAQRQLEADQQDQRTRAAGALDAAPLGADQSFAQKQALLHSILGATRNYSATPGDPAVAAAMGSTNQGGMRLPEGGFDPAMLERMFGDDATLSSLKSRQEAIGQLNPRAHLTDLAPMFGQAGADASHSVAATNSTELNRQMDESAKQRAIIQRAIDEDIRGDKQAHQQQHHGNIFGKILKGVGMGASFIPGVGQIVAPIATGLGGLVDGDGLKSSLVNAGLAAVPAGLGKVAKGVGTAAKVAQTAQKFKAPMIANAILGGR